MGETFWLKCQFPDCRYRCRMWFTMDQHVRRVHGEHPSVKDYYDDDPA